MWSVNLGSMGVIRRIRSMTAMLCFCLFIELRIDLESDARSQY